MKEFLLLFCFLFSLSAKAQTNVYHPFPDSNAVWNIYFEQYYITIPCTLSEFRNSYIISGDTIIKGLKYHKLWVPYIWGYSCNAFPVYSVAQGYQGSYREDSKR